MSLDTSHDVRAGVASTGEVDRLPPDVSACLDAARPEVGPLVLPGPRLREKLATGTPLLHGEDIAVEPRAVERAWTCLLDAFASVGPGDPDAVAGLRRALASHRLHLEHLTIEALVGHREHVDALAEAAGVPGDIVWWLADLAARPQLAAYARRLAPALGQGTWAPGYCPVCGAWPVRWEGAAETSEPATTDGADRAMLRCGRCATGWRADVSRCPCCREVGSLEAIGDQLADAGGPTVGVPAVGEPGVDEPAVGEPAVGGLVDAGGQIARGLGCRVCRRFLPIAGDGDGEPSLGALVDAATRAGAADALHAVAEARRFVRPTGAGFMLELADGEGFEGFDDD